MKLVSTDNRSLKTPLEEPVTGGPGKTWQLPLRASNAESISVPHVVTELETKTNNSIMYSPLSTPPEASAPGMITWQGSTWGSVVGQSSAPIAIPEKQKPSEPSAPSKDVGLKHDQSKPAIAYIPKAALYAEGEAFKFGAQKYDAWNYKNGLAVSRTLSATLRHLVQFLDGEDVDSESGVHHLGCARANIAMALDTLANHPEFDDRYKGGKK